jgi:hypothetical protein
MLGFCCAKQKRELSDSIAQVIDQNEEISRLRSLLAEKDVTIQKADQRISDLESQANLSSGLFSLFQHFGDSLVAMQNSLASLSKMLQEEKNTAIQAATESINAKNNNDTCDN